MRRRGRFAVAMLFSVLSILPFNTNFYRALAVIESYYFAAQVMINLRIDTTFQLFFDEDNRRLLVIYRYYDRSPNEFTLRLRLDRGAEETALVTIHSTILYGEVTWLGPDRLKLAFVVDPRASFDPPLAQVGAVRIDYVFIRGYEPPVWPYLVIERSR